MRQVARSVRPRIGLPNRSTPARVVDAIWCDRFRADTVVRILAQLGDTDAQEQDNDRLNRRLNTRCSVEWRRAGRTARVHVSNSLGKLGDSSRTEAANVALTQGLTEA